MKIKNVIGCIFSIVIVTICGCSKNDIQKTPINDSTNTQISPIGNYIGILPQKNYVAELNIKNDGSFYILLGDYGIQGRWVKENNDRYSMTGEKNGYIEYLGYFIMSDKNTILLPKTGYKFRKR